MKIKGIDCSWVMVLAVLLGAQFVCAPRAARAGALADDLRSIGGDPVFYGLVVPMIAAQPLLRHEDPELNEAWAGEGSADHFFELGNLVGNGLLPVAVWSACYGYNRFAKCPQAGTFASDLLRAQLLTGAATWAMKVGIDRRRPDGGPWSFPSGHTSNSFATAAVVYRHAGLKFGIPALAVASYVGFSRLQENRHYLSDVLAGAALGTYFGINVGRQSGPKRAGLSIELAPVGCVISWRIP